LALIAAKVSMMGVWATVCKTVRHMLSVRCLSVLSCLSVTLAYCGQTVGRLKMKLGMHVRLGPGHTGPPTPKRHSPPISGPYFLWSKGSIDQDASW